MDRHLIPFSRGLSKTRKHRQKRGVARHQRRVVVDMRRCAAIIAVSLLSLSCSGCYARPYRHAVQVADVCGLAAHPMRYAGKEISLTTTFINAPPHGIAFYSKKCPVPISIRYSQRFQRFGKQQFKKSLVDYWLDHSVLQFKITVIGHLRMTSDHASSRRIRFYFDKIVDLVPDQPPSH